MIAFNYNLNEEIKKGLIFTGAEWLLRAIEMKHPNCSVALAYSVRYQLESKGGLVSLREIPMFLN